MSVRIFLRAILACLALALVQLAPVEALASRATLVVDATTGKIIESKNAHATHSPASLTKMMTLYLVFDALEKKRLTMDQKLPVSAHAAGQPPTDLKVRTGDAITVRETILAMIVRSANDAAVVAAEALGGTEARFARTMTAKARELGMTRTTFRNASGLTARGQVTTAWDMALLARALQKRFPQYYPLFSTTKFSFRGVDYTSHNKLLGRYEGADGIKTGYTRASMFNLVTSAERDGRRVIGVVLGSKTGSGRDREMMALLDRSFGGATGTMLARAPAATLPGEPTESEATAAATRSVAAATANAEKSATLATLEVEETPQGSIGEAWGIQVGAYRDQDGAATAVIAALRRQPRLLSDAETVIVPVAGSKGTFYRARLYGLSEEDARAVCLKLRTKKSDGCLIVSPEGTTSRATVVNTTRSKKSTAR